MQFRPYLRLTYLSCTTYRILHSNKGEKPYYGRARKIMIVHVKKRVPSVHVIRQKHCIVLLPSALP